MTLTMRRSDRRDRRLCRIGVMLVVVSLVINMVAVPKAKAVVVESTAALGAAATVCVVDYSTAALLVSGMKTGAVTSSVIGAMDTYAAATGAAASGTALASTIGAGTVITAAGSLVLGAAAAIALIKFVEWLREEKGLEAGGTDVAIPVVVGRYNYLVNGTQVVFANEGTAFDFGPVYETEAGSRFSVLLIEDKAKITFVRPDGTKHEEERDYEAFHVSNAQYYCLYAGYGDKTYVSFRGDNYSAFNSSFVFSPYGFLFSPSGASEIESDLGLAPNPEFIDIPEEIPEGQVLSIDTGLASLPAEDPQAAADAIMQPIIDGTLAPTVSVEADPTVTPDPEPEPDPELPPDAPELPSNLGDLGKALTSRFPFSIPWDIYKAVKLLAAPAKAPYWEIDFMEPIKYRFEDIGDTTITLDFGKPEFEIIGVATRLTSTIGFCLALAAATKRFIWTA